MDAPEVIADTNEVLVLNKPAGLITHSDGRTVEPSVAEWIAEKYPALATVGESWVSPQGEHVRVCGIVHRLDRTTSGVVLVAKTDEMFRYFKGEFKARRVEKKYCALVHGELRGEGRISAEIARTSVPPKRWYAEPRPEDHVRTALTYWHAVGAFADAGTAYSYVELVPKTGRTHQLRVHMSSIGHPLVSDPLYGGEVALGFTRPALHARSISVLLDGKQETFTADFPDDFQAVFQKFGIVQ